MHQHFSRSYERARQHFLALCAQNHAVLEHILHPEMGPDGKLYADIALWGEPDCDHLLVITSATHGVEGYTGSGLQSLLLAEGLSQTLPAGTSLLMVHGVNPYGFAWQRRVTELNVDLNRNFINFDELPTNDAYLEIAELLEPDHWDEATQASIQQRFVELGREKGSRWLQGALTKGQYTHPNGFFYGGASPAWSNTMMRSVAERYIARARMATLVDVHTALGDFGTAECITTYATDSDEYRRARKIWGDRAQSTINDESLSVDVNGPMVNALQPYSDFLGIGLEFGTVDVNEVIMSLIADQWLHCHGEPDLKHPIKERMMNAFYPDSDEWRASITSITREIITQSLNREA